MGFSARWRTWHRWAGVVLALPVLVAACTAIATAHRKTLGSDEMIVAAWLPAYAGAGRAAGGDVRASLIAADGTVFLATQGGLFATRAGRAAPIEALAGVPVRGLAPAPGGAVVAAARSGIWLGRGDDWQRVVKGEAWSAAARADGSVVVALRDQGLLVSADGRNWRPDPVGAAAFASLPPGAAAQPLTLARFLIDLHTGKALFGKDGEWLWIDAVAGSLLFLAGTGAYLWWRHRRQRRPRQLPAGLAVGET